MATRGSNRQRNAWTIELLDLKPHDRFLEVGFGPGIALAMAAKRITTGRIVGIDHSDLMRRQAAHRNAAAIADGRMALHCGGLDVLAHIDGGFTKVASANVVQFWDDPQTAFGALFRVMADGGRIATTYQPRHMGATAADADDMATRIMDWMRAAGFRCVNKQQLPLKSLPAVCVLGVK